MEGDRRYRGVASMFRDPRRGERDVMNQRKKFSAVDRLRSFRYAAHGIAIMLRTEHNAWLHMAATFAVLITGFSFGLARYEWCWIVLAIVAVWTAEALNTAFEFLADVTYPKFHPMVEKAKDVAAGAVLITSLGAVIIGCIIIGPYVLALFR